MSYQYKRNNVKSNSGIMSAIFSLIFVFLVVFGWGNNIVKLAKSDFSNITGLEVVRVIGVFVFPVGIIAGYF